MSMTNEERAEEYIRTDGTNGERVWKKILKEFPKCITVDSKESKKRLAELLCEYTKVVYLDGMAEGKPKWHDLREDPNDIPKEDCETVTLHENGNKNIIKWKHGEWTNAIVIPVIAWCELPKFKEKE